MHYARLVMQNAEIIRFPALTSIHLQDWVFPITRAATEEQIHSLGANPVMIILCRFGCDLDENAYDVTSACPVPEFTTRHVEAEYNTLRDILVSTEAPKHILFTL